MEQTVSTASFSNNAGSLSRLEVKKQHERAIVARFLNFYNDANGTHFVVDSEPEPPEAIAKDGDNYIWLEVTDAYWSDEYAKDLNSFATGEAPQPVGGGPFMNMDAQHAERFVRLVRNKLSKSSYKPACDAHGKGILIVGMISPFFNETTIKFMRRRQQETASEPSVDLRYFGKIYLYDGYTFSEYEW